MTQLRPMIVPIDDWDLRDPRGLFMVWEPPKQRETYILGIDPAGGIQGWDRKLRTSSDGSTDNSVIEVLRVGHRGDPDVQVAEFAAPVNPLDLCTYANAIGRAYAGRDETGMAQILLNGPQINSCF